MDKEVREIADKLVKQGWRIEDGAKHTKAYPPDPTKSVVILPGTPARAAGSKT